MLRQSQLVLTIKPKAILIFLFLLIASLNASHIHAQEQYIFWIGSEEGQPEQENTLFRYSLSSESVDTLTKSSEVNPAFSTAFYYVTVDIQNDDVYWTTAGFEDDDGLVFLGAIMRSAVSGDDIQLFLAPNSCGLGGPTDIQADPVAERVYWGRFTSCLDSELFFVDYDTPVTPPEFTAVEINSLHEVTAFEIDLKRSVVYWTNYDPDRSIAGVDYGIYRASLSDPAISELIIEQNICDIALAHYLNKIYWIPCAGKSIMRANLDGTDAEEVLMSQGDPSYLAIDNDSGMIYWTEKKAGLIRRANLDGTGVEDLVTDLFAPGSLALSFGADRVSVEEESTQSERFWVQGIYPNPVFNQATMVFSLFQPDRVTVEIYDVLGRRIDIITSQVFGIGTHRIEWAADSIPRGLYFTRVIVGSETNTTPFVVQR